MIAIKEAETRIMANIPQSPPEDTLLDAVAYFVIVGVVCWFVLLIGSL